MSTRARAVATGLAAAITILGAFAPGAVSSEQRPSSLGYRFVRPPVVGYEPATGGTILYVAVRLNKALPPPGQPAGAKDINVGTPGGSACVQQEGSTSYIGRKTGHCYFAFNPGPGPKSLRHPKVGQEVSVTVHSGSVLEISTRVRIRERVSGDPERSFSKLLGCSA